MINNFNQPLTRSKPKPGNVQLAGKASLAKASKSLTKLLYFCQYLLFQERCRLCNRFIHPEVSGMDYRYFSPPATYSFANNQTTVNTWCRSCSLSLGQDQVSLRVYESLLARTPKQPLIVISKTRFVGNIKKLIYKCKYDQDMLLAKDLAIFALDTWTKLKALLDPTAARLVPVPLHRDRLRQRGFNQAELLAAHLSSFLGIKMSTRALQRTKKTASQQELGKVERAYNVANAFKANTKLVHNKQIILIDDVCTSGATLVECASTLRSAGALTVVALTIARVD